jgi:diaminopropionate ammonia-lyase family
VYLPESVPESQADRVRAYNADVRRVSGNYEAALQQCRDDASAESNYEIVQDVSWDNYTAVPRRIWEGYATIASEILDDKDNPPPTHVFVNSGVGGLATGLCGYFWDRLGSSRPRFITVEPDQADCIMQSVIKGEPVTVKPSGTTCQVGLDCKRPDPIAFEVLLQGANDTVSIPDNAVKPTMQFLSDPSIGLNAGESGVAGMAALMKICQDEKMRHALELNEDSRVCIVVCEGVIG